MKRKSNKKLLEEMLKYCRKLSMERMYSIIPNREPKATFYDLMIEYPSRQGKGLRPALCISTCQAFGGSIEVCLNSAVVIELFHNTYLIHDDIEDGSTHRRGKLTLWVENGMPIAINAGDGLLALAIRPLLNNVELLGVEKTFKIAKEIANMAQYSAEGQAIELGWVRDNNWMVTEKNYLLMCLKKTCWYTCIIPCRIGAIAAGESKKQVMAFNKIGYRLGIAFQIQDDILNLVGDETLYGKEIAGDIWEGKRTIVLIHLLHELKDEELKKVIKILSTPRNKKNSNDVYWILQLMKEHGCIEYALICKKLLEKLLKQILSSKYSDFLREIVYYVIERKL